MKICYLKIKIVCFCLIFCGLFSVAAAQTKTARIQKLLDETLQKGEFSGAVLAAIDNKIVYQNAVGLANREWNLPNQAATRFRICSVTKQFTAMLVMQLVEAGKIKLDAPVSDYLPDFRPNDAEKITVRHLLLSASGLPNLPEAFYVDESAKMTDANFVITTYLQGERLFAPGERFNYNNGDFITLGAILEKVAGKSYETVLSERILQPLGMKNSGLLRNENIVPNLANGYIYKDKTFRREGFVQIENFGAAGAMFSTVEDLFLWDKALISNKILSKKFTDEMFTPSPKLGFVALGSWNYGLKLADGKERRMIERQGYINGFCMLNLISTDEKISVILLGNLETQNYFQTYAKKGLGFEILQILTEK